MNDVPAHWGNVLQALAHWVAYKKEYFHGHLLPEGAIVAELTQLLSAKIDVKQKLECERMYKEFDSSIKTTIRADIVIGDKPAKLKDMQGGVQKHIHLEQLTEVIEVKRYEGRWDKTLADFKKLARLKGIKSDLRLFQVIVAQQRLPEKLFNKKYRIFTKNICPETDGLNVRARMSKKAYFSRKSETNGVFAVLVEVL